MPSFRACRPSVALVSHPDSALIIDTISIQMMQNKLQRHCTQLCRSAATPTVTGSHLIGCSSTNPAQHPTSSSAARSRGHGRPRTLAVCALPAESGVDVVGFGNLCVDAVLPMEQLPPPDVEVRRRLLDSLTGSPPDKSAWEVGGNCNFMVAAARLGMQVASVGHIGADVYGEFMDEVLRSEGIQATTRIAPLEHTMEEYGNSDSITTHSKSQTSDQQQHLLDSTLICFVLVDPASRHAFCSRYDFGPWPLLERIRTLPGEATAVLRAARAVFTNGFIFDELPLEAVQAACSDAIQHGAAIFFDPGPRCQTMMEGPRRAALDLLLDLSAVLLMTEEEARVVTGLEDPEAAAQWVLARPGSRAQWVVVKMGSQGALLCEQRNMKNSSASSSSSRSRTGNGNGNGDGRGNNAGNGCHGGLDGKSDDDVEVRTMKTTTTTTRMGAVKVKVVDTVGCGDSFAAAMVMGFTSGWPADVTLALANAVGGATATGRGAGRNVAQLEKVLALLAEGAATAAAATERRAFARAQELLLQSLANRKRHNYHNDHSHNYNHCQHHQYQQQQEQPLGAAA